MKIKTWAIVVELENGNVHYLKTLPDYTANEVEAYITECEMKGNTKWLGQKLI